MIIQATPYGTKKEEPFAFTYSGDFTDERVDGIGDVTLNTSGVFEVLSGKATVSVYILGAGGGGASDIANSWTIRVGTGGGGGKQTVEVELVPGTYEIVIGNGGAGATNGYYEAIAEKGGDTVAFGYTSTGGSGGYAYRLGSIIAGSGGAPNGNAGVTVEQSNPELAGGSPNGGGVSNKYGQDGGNGLVRITFS